MTKRPAPEDFFTTQVLLLLLPGVLLLLPGVLLLLPGVLLLLLPGVQRVCLLG